MSQRDGEFRLDPASIRAVRRPAGPVQVADRTLMLRIARLSDGHAWQRVRLAEQDRLAGTFDAEGIGWQQSSTLTAYAELWWERRAQLRSGRLVPFTAFDGDGALVGELGFLIDSRNGVAEASMWADHTLHPRQTTWIAAVGLLRIFACGVPRVVAPVAIDNPGPSRLLQQFGFEHQGVARRLRRHRGRIADHDVWWLDRDEEHLAILGSMAAGALA